jgi:hypothetical protein
MIHRFISTSHEKSSEPYVADRLLARSAVAAGLDANVNKSR